MDPVYLNTARFFLRPFVLADLPDLVDLDRLPGVMEFLSAGRPSSLEEWRDGFLPTIFGYYEKFQGDLGNWIAIEMASSRFVGWFHLRPDKKEPENTRKLELGYRLRPDFWGRGIATEISRALISKAFRELNADEVFARAMPGNLASIRVMEKSGMKFDGASIESNAHGTGIQVARYTIRRPETSL